MVQKIAKQMLMAAIDFNATDVYVLPAESEFVVRFRNSVNRKVYLTLSGTIGQSLISHFKFISGMNVGEKRRPQVGACTYQVDKQDVRLRLSTAGNFEHKESLVLRLLPENERPLLFWFEDDLNILQQVAEKRGLYLFSGPVGSGKTSLMHYIVKEKFSDKQVITIEDPVELVRSELLQFQLNDMIGNTYDTLIKLSLRHMPDLVIVGEIRDEETARAVVRASLTGYTVFSTVHARSIKGVYARLLELGVTPSELANALSGIIYQRLIAGKGVLTYANQNFSKHSNDPWNAKMDSLVTKGAISTYQAEKEKIINEATT